MKVKTIRHTLYKAVKEWIDSIEDKDLKEEAAQSVMVTGGSIASMLRGEPVNDYDLYFDDREVVLKLITYYARPYRDSISVLDGEYKQEYIDTYQGDFNHINAYTIAVNALDKDRVTMFFNSKAGHSVVEKGDTVTKIKPYQPLFFSPNAITLANGIQIITRFHGHIEEIHKNFDFLHATNMYKYSCNKIYWKTEAILAAVTGELKYVGSLYPLTSIIRTKKFLQRGYTINAGEQLKMMFDVSLLDLTNVAVLSEQLIGVDVAYFNLLINLLLAKEGDIDRNHVVDLINDVFDTLEHDED